MIRMIAEDVLQCAKPVVDCGLKPVMDNFIFELFKKQIISDAS